jgi:tRNA(Arg) A34 adenosine deaminase TadA
VYWARIDRVYFGTFAEDAAQAGFDDSVIYGEIAQPRAERKIPMLSMMRDEAIAAFQAWKESPGKIGY